MRNISQDYPEFAGNASDRDRIVRSYEAQGAARARDARAYSQEASMLYKQNAQRARERAQQREMLEAKRREEEAVQAEKRARMREMEAAQARVDPSMRKDSFQHRNRAAARPAMPPRSAQERREYAMSRAADFEHERDMRDALASSRYRNSNREVIDGRGSFDSRALNEHNELVGYTIDERDRHEPMLDTSDSTSRWRSQDGHSARQASPFNFGNKGPRVNVGFSTNIAGASIRNGNTPKSGGLLSGIPALVKIAVPIIVILAIVLWFILNP